jgi:hypothetical protein
MTAKTFGLVTCILFWLGALAHLARLNTGWHITLGSTSLPIWVSWIGLAIGTYLGYEGFKLSRTTKAQ